MVEKITRDWHRIKLYFKRAWNVIVDIITDREFKRVILEADKSKGVVPFKFTTRPNKDEGDIEE